MSASVSQTGLGGAEAPEPHSRLGPADAIPCALRAHVWSGHFTKQQGDPARCRAAVPEGGRSPMFHQCSRKPTVFRECAHPKGRFGFCAVHDPVVIAQKKAAKEAKWRREWDESNARIRLQAERKAATEQCIAVLREIEAGHNDPRIAAREALARLDATYSDPPSIADSPNQ